MRQSKNSNHDGIDALDRTLEIARSLERDIEIFGWRSFFLGVFVGAALILAAWIWTLKA